MATDARDQVIEKIRVSTFVALQFDESTDIADCAQFVLLCIWNPMKN